MRIALRSSPGKAALALAALAFAAGCETFSPAQTCDTSPGSNPPVVYDGGFVRNHVYMSSEWGGRLLWFPWGQSYEIRHKLGTTPTSWQLYLSFVETGASDGGTLAQAAGDEAQVMDVGPDSLTVTNYTCSTYYLLVVAEAGVPAP